MLEDYTKYLSIDNGRGVLISRDDLAILERFKIDFFQASSLKELILQIEECLEEDYDEDLETVIDHLSEVYYYEKVNK